MTTVDSAAAALDQIEASPPDVIVADVGLPVMDGFRFIQAVRNLGDGG